MTPIERRPDLVFYIVSALTIHFRSEGVNHPLVEPNPYPSRKSAMWDTYYTPPPPVWVESAEPSTWNDHQRCENSLAPCVYLVFCNQKRLPDLGPQVYLQLGRPQPHCEQVKTN